ncbi:bile acid:sodium symporter family protein [Paracoccus sp. WLY502]|uniref:bile acid:sodium symporter family protein n=1 Tax=Paracoccus yibinensis TaxID=3068891 RepID=UPI002796CE13|nr:bile acid:sodium symporter family protein [Paracoccus sp. WLY502]MDQ1901503.1 bile acid:sodium symporter family protein [Paracoccus sp. WLY502]
MSLRRAEAVLARFGFDRYMLMLVLTVVLATVLPARGAGAAILSHVTYWVIALLFFLYGAKLSTATIVAGLANWRLQLSVLALTFLLFPVLALALKPLSLIWLPTAIGVGFLYIGCLPSTVQSSIAFTAVSGGNVAGAVCAASISNLIGVVLSPLLFALLIPQGTGYGIEPSAIWKIVQQILLPFAAGQLCRPLLAGWLARYRRPAMIVDRGSILLIVYAAFSAGVVNGIWQVISGPSLAVLVALCLALLAAVMGAAVMIARMAGMGHADLMAVLYCGSTKSLATGLPMAGILFAGQDISLVILPLMVFHLLQLAVCAVISQRMAGRLDLRAAQ